MRVVATARELIEVNLRTEPLSLPRRNTLVDLWLVLLNAVFQPESLVDFQVYPNHSQNAYTV